MKNIAIILASGAGSRFGTQIPKQFVRLAGKPVIQYTIEAFEQSKEIDEIIVVTKQEYIDFIYDIANENFITKISKVIVGGKERYDSTLSALNAINEAEANLIIHDAVRPFVSGRIISDCIKALEHFKAIDVVVDATDTIVKVENEIIQEIPDRRFLKRGQTPQAFKKTILKQAYEKFLKDDEKVASDDCGIVLKYLPDIPIKTIVGEEANFKLTHQQDIYLADNLIKDGLTHRLEHDKEKLNLALQNKNIFIIGGSSGIGLEIANLAQTYGANVFSCSRRLYNVNVADKKSIKKALDLFYSKEKKIDFVINTAGYLLKKAFINMSDKEIQDSYETNYIGVLNVAQACFKYLAESRGMLINFSSSSYTRGRPNYSIYSSTKAAVVNFTQALAEEWLPHGIKVNVINPERTATPMRTSNFGLEPAETLLSTEEVAFFTLSAMSFNHTGQIYSIKKDI